MNLKSLSIGRLTTLRDQVEVTLKSRITQARHDLEARLAKLPKFSSLGVPLGKRRGPVPPKYRNPENRNETWAGRGLKPRWLAAALKAGNEIEDFLIGGAPKATAGKSPTAPKKRKAPARKKR